MPFGALAVEEEPGAAEASEEAAVVSVEEAGMVLPSVLAHEAKHAMLIPRASVNDAVFISSFFIFPSWTACYGEKPSAVCCFFR